MGKEKQSLGVGLVGYGGIGRVHTMAYINLPSYYEDAPYQVGFTGVASRSEANRQKALDRADFKYAREDYHELMDKDEIDLIDCCTPNRVHLPVMMAAIKAGKHVYCEKPLARDVKEALEITRLAEGKGVRHQLAFQNRFVPAVMRAKQLIEEEALGEVFNFRAHYLHSGYIDPERQFSWRLSREESGGGALFDLGAHILDLIRYLLGDYQRVQASLETFIRERPDADTPGEYHKVDVDDLALLRVRMENGYPGTIEASRVATGTNDDLGFTIHGSRGALGFNLMEPNWLRYYDAAEPGQPIGGLRGVKKIETVQHYPETNFPGPKFAVGWIRSHIASQHDFLRSLVTGEPAAGASFIDGLRVQEVMGAAQQSAENGGWVEVNRNEV